MAVWVLLACATPVLAAPSTLKQECDAARGKQPVTATNPLAVRVTKSSAPIRGATLQRFDCPTQRNSRAPVPPPCG